MSKKIADLNLDDAEFLNDSLIDFYNDTETDILEDTSDESDTTDEDIISVNDNTIVDTTLDAEEDDFEEDENLSPEDSEVEVPTQVDTLDDYNTLALIALSLKEEAPDFIDFNIDKDIKPDVLINQLKASIEKNKDEISKQVESNYGEAAKYLKLILEGASQQTVSTALSYNQIASLDITGDEDESQLEQIVSSWLNAKGTPDASDLIEVYKDKGVLVDKAKDAVAYHKEQEELFFNEWQKNRDIQIAEAQKQQLEYEKSIKSQINKGVVKGLAIKDKKRLEDSIFKPTELVEYIDDSGQKRLQKVPLIQVKMQEFQKDIEQQLALQLLLLDGFDFSSLVDTAKRKVNSNLMNTLNERTSTPTIGGKKSSSTYFDD